MPPDDEEWIGMGEWIRMGELGMGDGDVWGRGRSVNDRVREVLLRGDVRVVGRMAKMDREEQRMRGGGGE